MPSKISTEPPALSGTEHSWMNLFFGTDDLMAATAPAKDTLGKSTVTWSRARPTTAWWSPERFFKLTIHSPFAVICEPPATLTGNSPLAVQNPFNWWTTAPYFKHACEQPLSSIMFTSLDFPGTEQNINMGFPVGTGSNLEFLSMPILSFLTFFADWTEG